MKIFGWAAGHHGCGQYRVGLPMWALGRAGHDALAFVDLNMDLPPDVDILVGQLMTTDARGAKWRSLAGGSAKLIFEVDDDLWDIHPTNKKAYDFYNTDEAKRNLVPSIEVSDAVTVSTEPLAEVVRQYNPNVYVLPNCVDEALLLRERPRRERLTVGWAGSSSHYNDFRAAQDGVRQFLRRNPDVDTHFVGMNYGRLVGRPDSPHTPWSWNLVEYLANIDFDIGIAPLAANRFNRSKSDIKFLEYAALGIPVVASDFGPYAASIQHGITGFLVKRPHEWGVYLRELVNDHDLREQMSANAKAWATTRTIQANIWRWEEAYGAVLARDLVPSRG